MLLVLCYSLLIYTFYTHSDAPAISEEATSGNEAKEESQWDEEALAAKMTSSTTVVVNEKEILDVKTLSQNTQEQSDNIKERLKLEETKAALQAARDGMEREAQRLREEEQDQTMTTVGSGRFSAAAATMDSTSTGGKWVPPHMRASGGMSLTRRSMGTPQKLDTKDETLFPDLSTADKILEQEKKLETVAYKPPKKTPVGGTWGMAARKKPAAVIVKEEEEEAPKEEQVAPVKETPAPKPSTTTSEPPKTLSVKKKKKKKDLSTFKPASS